MPRNKNEHVSLWHPWLDKPGQRHKLALWSDFNFSSVDETVQAIGQGEYYAICRNILSRSEVDTSLLRDTRTEAYLSRSGNVSALRVRSARKNGFLIPSIQWGSREGPSRELVERMQYIFDKFGYEAITPSSLSEKILRSTLPEKLYISRPNQMLRDSLINHGKGGRIQHKSGKWTEAFEHDINKAYLDIAAKGVPDPQVTPIRFYQSSIWENMPCSWLQVEMTCHRDNGIQPIQIKDKDSGELREPRDGECFTDWLWSGEIRDCIKAGYTLDGALQGWSFPIMSNFMEQWADILWRAYTSEYDEHVRDIEKGMMVGLPGRFLKSPEKYTLIHYTESQKGDVPIVAPLMEGESPMSDWCMRIEEDQDSAQLTPIGGYIISECRRRIYRDSRKEEVRGKTVIRIYVDSFTMDGEATEVNKGEKRGEYKTKRYTKVRISHNRFIGYLDGVKEILKAPGVSGEKQREKVVKELQSCLVDSTCPP